MRLLRPFILTAASLWVLSYFLPTITVANWTTLAAASVVLVLLNTLVRPILKILFLPINVITLGLFSVVINVVILWLAMYFVPGFEVSNMVVLGVPLNRFFSILFASFLIGITQSVFGMVV